MMSVHIRGTDYENTNNYISIRIHELKRGALVEWRGEVGEVSVGRSRRFSPIIKHAEQTIGASGYSPFKIKVV